MPDSSSSSLPAVSENSELPDSYTICLTPDDFIEIYSAALRFASAPIGADTVDVAFTPEQHTWWFREGNIKGCLHYPYIEDEFTGTLTLPMYLLQAIADSKLAVDEDNIELLINFVEKTITYTVQGCTFTVPLPHQQHLCVGDIHPRSKRIIVQAPQLAQVGPFLMQVPVHLPDDIDESIQSEFPFINFSYDGTDLIITRDWSRFDGPVLTLSVPAGGDYRGSFSVYGHIISRELNEISNYSTGVCSFEFNEEHPNLCHITCGNFGMVVELGLEHVFRHRRRLEMELSSGKAELDVTRDSRVGWDPVVVVTAGSRTVTATITPDDDGEAKYVRLNVDIMSDVVWSSELATEMNAWNDQWPSVKLLHTNGVLHAVSDVPVAAIPVISDTVVDLVAKAQIVDELIGAVL